MKKTHLRGCNFSRSMRTFVFSIRIVTLIAVLGLSLGRAQAADMISVLQQTLGDISGSVLDKSGEPIIGASVLVKGTTTGTVTDFDGKFILKNVPQNAILVFKYVGMKMIEVPIKGKTLFRVVLESDAIDIDEVVVVGYGTQKKVNLTGAVSAVKFDEQLSSRSLPNVSMALQGKVPGLAISQNSGVAGDKGMTMLIRGMGTVNDANPLIVVDGMPDVDINRLNMDDIESVSVLKDAASSAVYGSRAANGVILITTKSGKGSKSKINASASYSIGIPVHAWEYMSDYARSLTLLQRNAAVSTAPDNFRFKNGTIDQWMAMGMIDPLRYPNTDWYDVILRTGGIQKYNISASGSNDKSNYFVSVGIMDEDGLLMNNDYTQYNARMSYDMKIFPNLTIGTKFSGNWSKMQYANTNDFQGTINAASMKFAVAGITPYDPVTGYYGGAMAYGEDSQVFNPYSAYTNQLSQKDRQEANGNISLSWDIIKGLNARVDYTINYYNQFRYQADIPTRAYDFQKGVLTDRRFVEDNAGVSNYTNTGYKTQLNARLGYDVTIKKNHNLSVMAAFSREYWFNRYQMSSAKDRIHSDLHEINATLNVDPSVEGYSSAQGLMSFIGRINYAAFNKYLFEVNLRSDGSSKFLYGYRYSFFPSGSVGWIFSEEPFINRWAGSWLSRAKLRASYGKLGNNSAVGEYEQLETLSSSSYFVNGALIKGLVNKKMINRDLTWEETAVTNVGLDLGFLKNHLSVEIDYYDRFTTKMIRPSDFSILLSGAYSSPRKNIGNMRNKGVEVNVTYQGAKGDFNYMVNVNASYNATILEKWNEYLGSNTTYTNKDGNADYVFVGMPYNYVSAYEAIGIAQTWNDIYNATPQGARPGDLLYKDLNGDGKIDDSDKRVYPRLQRDRPTTNFALNSNFEWRGIDLSIMFQGAAGRKAFWLPSNNNTSLGNNEGRTATTWDLWNKTWSVENRDGGWTRLGGGNNRKESTFYLDNLAYLRLKNVQLGYSIPKSVIQKIRISNIRVFFSADNLLTFSKFRGLDPEKLNVNDGYPLMKTFTFGLNVEI
ncbi:SusC/RagA family TonB-linked outer membrane protein [Gabonia massiliensis]|uniref:SusC/RagA family TonB-linked outer membrane protein n=1 Tax=Gabonia massiliensis TaxID=1686296 RepID=UPI0006D7DDE0|nr:TonB-dependent receptor [Gabonia massiliensis]